MPYETGDILVFVAGRRFPWGHVGLICEVGPNGFYLFEAADREEQRNPYGFRFVENREVQSDCRIYRSPWNMLNADAALNYKRRLMSVAYTLHWNGNRAQYFGATRLYLGNKSFKQGARNRIDTYRERFDNFPVLRSEEFAAGYTNIGSIEIKNGTVLTDITCVPAVLLCYHLTFREGAMPFFIPLDPEHTLPMTLDNWLQTHWTLVNAGGLS